MSLFDKRYDLDYKLGQGYFSDVWYAHNTRPDISIPKTVALKIFRKERFPDQIANLPQRFEKIVHKMRSIQHEYIVRVYDGGLTEAGDEYYLVMQLIEGPDLGKRLKRGTLSWKNARLYLGCVVKALNYLHSSHHIAHGDIKPSNILVEEDTGVAYLADLGLIHILDSENLKTRSGQIFPATWHYMAPELWDGKRPSFASDVYALAATLYEMLTARKLVNPEKQGPGSPIKGFVDQHCYQSPKLDCLARTDFAWAESILRQSLDEYPENRPTAVNFYNALLERLLKPQKNSIPPLPDGDWRIWAQAHRVYDILIHGSNIWLATDIGLMRWQRGIRVQRPSLSAPKLWTVANGLPHRQVNALSFRRNIFWAGTPKGLAWGYPPFFKTIPRLSGIEVHDVVTTPQSVWAATAQGLARLEVRGNEIEIQWCSLPDQSPDEVPYCLHYQESRRRLWIGLQHSVICQDISEPYDKRTFHADDGTGFPPGEVRAITETQNERIWVLTSQRLAFYQPYNTWSQLECKIDESGRLLQASLNDLWIGWREGVLRCDPQTGTEHRYSVPKIKNPSVIQESQEGIILCARGNVFELTPEDDFQQMPALNQGILDNDIRALVVGKRDELWVGSRKGICRRTQRGWESYQTSSKVEAKEIGCGHGSVLSLAYSHYDDSLWVATGSRCISYHQKEQWKTLRFRRLGVGNTRVLQAARNGCIWVGTDMGLWYIDRHRSQPRCINSSLQGISSIIITGDGLWIGTDEDGIWYWDYRQWQRIDQGRDRKYKVQTLCHTADEALWASTLGGVARFSRNQWFSPLEGTMEHKVLCIYQSRDRALWLGTQKGLARVGACNNVRWFREGEYLLNNEVRTIVQTADGSLWIGTAGGLVCFSPR
jgi:serine/threonine protein kinase